MKKRAPRKKPNRKKPTKKPAPEIRPVGGARVDFVPGRVLSVDTRKRIYELRRDGEPLFRIGQAYNLTPEEVGLVLAEPIQ